MKWNVFTVFFGQVCTVGAIDIFELIPALDTYVGTKTLTILCEHQ